MGGCRERVQGEMAETGGWGEAWCGNNAVEASMRITLVRTFSNGGSRVCTGHLLEPSKTSRGGSGCCLGESSGDLQAIQADV